MRGGILVFLSIPQRVATKQYRITYLISFVLQLRIKPTQYFKWDMNISVLWGDVKNLVRYFLLIFARIHLYLPLLYPFARYMSWFTTAQNLGAGSVEQPLPQLHMQRLYQHPC